MNRFSYLLLLFSFVLGSCIGSQPPAPVSFHGQSAGAGSSGIHTVVDGDTLWRISKNYRLSMRGIAEVNNLRSPFALEVGQRIKLPPPNEYKVRSGDSLYSISRLFGVSMSKLASMNNLRAPYRIHEGQVLRLPSTYTQTYAQAKAAAKEKSIARSAAPPQKPQAAAARPKPKPKAPITAKTPSRSSGRFMRPVSGSVISSYGPKAGGLHNDGINILAPRGTPVRAAENGVVVYAGSELKGSGNLVLVRHADRWMSAYAHMDKISIKRGDVIKRGQALGTVGSTGSVDRPQLHFELRRGTSAVNPKKYIEG